VSADHLRRLRPDPGRGIPTAAAVTCAPRGPPRLPGTPSPAGRPGSDGAASIPRRGAGPYPRGRLARGEARRHPPGPCASPERVGVSGPAFCRTERNARSGTCGGSGPSRATVLV
jgi:hypothetical protein